jgi:hypothetical protein
VLSALSPLLGYRPQTGRADEAEQPMGQPTAEPVLQSPEALDQIIAPIALYPDAPEFHRTRSLQGHYSLHE